MEYLTARRTQTLDPLLLDGAGCVGADVRTSRTDDQILALLASFLARALSADRNGSRTSGRPSWCATWRRLRAKLAAVAGEKYSYRELDEFTDIMEKALLATGRKDVGAPLVAKVDRSGMLPEKIYLLYSQERLASYGIKPGVASQHPAGRNLTVGRRRVRRRRQERARHSLAASSTANGKSAMSPSAPRSTARRSTCATSPTWSAATTTRRAS